MNIVTCYDIVNELGSFPEGREYDNIHAFQRVRESQHSTGAAPSCLFNRIMRVEVRR